MDALQQHMYTGNVRELINILQRAVTLSEDEEIEVEDLMLEQGVASEPVIESESTAPDKDEDQSLDSYIEDIEKQKLEEALIKARYNKTRAAEMLGISFRSFRYKLKKYGID